MNPDTEAVGFPTSWLKGRFVLPCATIALLLMLLPAPAAKGTPGGVDPTFGSGGIVTTPIGTTGVKRDEAQAVAIQPDGKIVVAGFTSSSDNLAFAEFTLARYNPDGSLDTTCDEDGTTTIADFRIAYALALQAADGKIVVAGAGGAFENAGFALARYNAADCSLDTSFGGDGKVATAFTGGTVEAKALAIQDDGRIVAAGSAGGDFGLARFNQNGTLDTACDGDGKATTSFGPGSDNAEALAIQSDGKLVAAGQSSFNFALVRYNATCALDNSFDGDGMLTTDIAFSDKAWALAIQSDGKLVAAGRADGDFDFALVRYNASGSLDTTCDGDGRVTTDLAPNKQDSAFALRIQADGKLVAAGDADLSPTGFSDVDRDFALARYNPDCSLDTNFDGNGTLTTDIGDLNQNDVADGLAIQPNGNLVAVGTADMGPPDAFDFDFSLVRYLGDGYPRPAGATPLRTSLVPAYTPCGSPNREHGPPLVFGSCNPPVPTSVWLTVGTADANGQATNSVGFVRLRVSIGNPGTPADEADVQMTARITDVRNASGLADYTGEVQVRSTVRITDKLNGSVQTEPGTVQDTPFPVTVPCVATASTTIGGTCSITTSYDAVVPGAINEGKRAIWELGRVLVSDGGADGVVSTTPNGVFARQGVFVP